MRNRFLSQILEEAKEGNPGGGGTPNSGVTSEAVQQAIEKAVGPFAASLASITETLAKLTAPPPVVTPPVEAKLAKPIKDLPPDVAAILQEQTQKIEQLTGRVTDLSKSEFDAKKSAEEANRRSELSTALAGIEFTTPMAQSVVVDRLFAKMQRSAIDGSLVIDGLPLKSVVKKECEAGGDFAFAVKPKSAGGAGASNGGQGSDGLIAVGDLKKLSPEDQAAVIRNTFKNRR